MCTHYLIARMRRMATREAKDRRAVRSGKIEGTLEGGNRGYAGDSELLPQR
jgi:hypothetical protein